MQGQAGNKIYMSKVSQEQGDDVEQACTIPTCVYNHEL